MHKPSQGGLNFLCSGLCSTEKEQMTCQRVKWRQRNLREEKTIQRKSDYCFQPCMHIPLFSPVPSDMCRGMRSPKSCSHEDFQPN